MKTSRIKSTGGGKAGITALGKICSKKEKKIKYV